MAVLSAADRADIWARLMRLASDERVTLGMTKAELRAAVDAADTWADSNSGSFNAALPLPARTALNNRQKALLLAYTVLRRYEVTP